MLSKEKIENNRIPKQLVKILGIKKDDNDSLIVFKESVFEQTVKENIKLKKQVDQLETNNQKLIDKLEEDNKKAKQGFETTLSSYEHGIMNYTQEILEILKGEKE